MLVLARIPRPLPAAARALCQASTEAGGGSLLASVGAKVRGALTPDKAQAGAARVLDEARAQGKSLSEATSDAMASYRKARKDENFQAFNQMLLEVFAAHTLLALVAKGRCLTCGLPRGRRRSSAWT